jgi:hypothetical protein
MKQQKRRSKGWRRADHNFAVATIALMIFFLVAGFSAWMFGNPGTAIGSAAAQAPGTCEGKAIGKDGRELAGAARTAFLTKCKRDACAPKAVGSDGKPLKGAAKNSFMAKCEREQG